MGNWRKCHRQGLMQMAEECGITKPFMDVAITPLGQGAGPPSEPHTLLKVNGDYLWEVVSHNVPSAWDWLRGYKKIIRSMACL